MTAKNILGRYIYTGREYVQEMINMRGGDIFMGAFNAEQVMYNHFGYRSPIPNLYNAGSAGHPGGAISGGAGYITAGLIAQRFGAQAMVDAVGRAGGARTIARAGKRRGLMICHSGAGRRPEPGKSASSPCNACRARKRRRTW